MINILIVDDHDFTRQSLYFGLNKSEDIKVIAEATNGEMAIEMVNKYKPDVVLMDIAMPFLDGIDATRLIKEKSPNTKILMFTSHNDKQKVMRALNSGADGYCIKDIEMNELINVIIMVSKGTIWIDPAIAKYLIDIFSNANFVKDNIESSKEDKIKHFKLTPRELEILKLISEGLNNKDICNRLFLSTSTVKNHVSNIIQKLSVHDRTQAALTAIKESII